MKIEALTFKAICVMVFGLSLLSTSQAKTGCQNQAEPPKIVRKSGGVLQGSATRRVTPAYPPLAKAARVSGAVVVEVTVDEEGNVMSARAVSGHPLLKDASVAAARGWKFKPTTLGGEPVKVIGTITFNFTPPSEEDIERAKEEVLANPNSADAHINLGEAYRAMSRYEEAATAFETAVGLDPRSAKAHRALAQAYTGLVGHKEGSIKHLKEAIRLDPDYIDSYRYLGALYLSLGREEEAVEVYKQALSRNPEGEGTEFIYTALGDYSLRLGRYQEALDAFRQAIAVNPRSAASGFGSVAYRGLCETYIKMGDKASAMAVYEIVKEINPPLADMMLADIKKMP